MWRCAMHWRSLHIDQSTVVHYLTVLCMRNYVRRLQGKCAVHAYQCLQYTSLSRREVRTNEMQGEVLRRCRARCVLARNEGSQAHAPSVGLWRHTHTHVHPAKHQGHSGPLGAVAGGDQKRDEPKLRIAHQVLLWSTGSMRQFHRLLALRRGLLEHAMIVRSLVRRENLTATTTLAPVILVHVIEQAVVVLHHVQLPDGCTGRGWGHPRSFPGLVLLD